MFDSAGSVLIGAQAGSTGSFTVSNGGELKTGINGVGVGLDGGAGTLTVDNGKVTSAGLIGIGFGSSDATSPGSDGKMLVSNAGVVTADGILVGQTGGKGELNITSGSQVSTTNGVTVAGGDGAQGFVNIDGGSKLTATGSLAAGVDGGTATINVDGNQSSLTSNSLILAVGPKADGKLNVANGASVAINDTILVGDNGTLPGQGPQADPNNNSKGAITVSGGSTLSTQTAMYLGLNGGSGTLTISKRRGSHSAGRYECWLRGWDRHCDIDRQGTRLESASQILLGYDIGGNAPATTGTLTVADGATVRAANGIVVGLGTGSGTLNIGTGAPPVLSTARSK